eukprot:8808342-Alexandrium_andersonii.AAC.1
MAASVRLRAALRRLERFQSQYRLRGRVLLALVSALEGICTDLEGAVAPNSATLVETGGELLTCETNDEEAENVNIPPLSGRPGSAQCGP